MGILSAIGQLTRPTQPSVPRGSLMVLDRTYIGRYCSCLFSADGNYCVTCGADKTIKLWNPHKMEDGGGIGGLLLKTYTGHGYEVIDAQCSCDSSQLCSCSLDKTVFLWDVATGKITNKYRGHAGTLYRIQDGPTNPNLNPTTKQHAIVNIQLNIVKCPTYLDNLYETMLLHHCATLGCNCHTAYAVATLIWWQFVFFIVFIAVGRVNCVQFNEDSSLVISGSVDGSVRVWDCRSRRLEPVQV